MSNLLQLNIVYLSEHLTNFPSMLNHLLQNHIITSHEKENLLLPNKTSYEKNSALVELLIRKDWDLVGSRCIDIFRNTGNWNCADSIEGKLYLGNNGKIKVLPEKWWPEKKTVVNAFVKRTSNDKLLIEKIQSRLLKTYEGSDTIVQKVVISGFGGIGKTTTALWFAEYYENDYEYIIWIDCGEESLHASFKSLGNNLGLPNWNKLDRKTLSRKCFQILCKYKCLLIFDNADCYIGRGGIKDVLPDKKITIFHSIITSRAKLWGTSNAHGIIKQIGLVDFQMHESIEFLRKYLKDTNYEERELKKLGNLLGGIPLSWQVAVAMLNTKQITVTQYIDRITKTEALVHSEANFDSYEKTINRTIKTSVDFIKVNETCGPLAFSILEVFSYIKSNDVDVGLFSQMLNREMQEICEAIDLLCNNSMISRRGANSHSGNNVEKLCIVHRLIQQVIRVNTNETREKEILRKVLNNVEFRETKLHALKYAEKHNDLRSLVLNVKRELPYHLRVNDLEREDAVVLSEVVRGNVACRCSAFVTVALILYVILLSILVAYLHQFPYKQYKCETEFCKLLWESGIFSLDGLCYMGLGIACYYMMNLHYVHILFFTALNFAFYLIFVTAMIIIQPTNHRIYFVVMYPAIWVLITMIFSFQFIYRPRRAIYNHGICLTNDEKLEEAIDQFMGIKNKLLPCTSTNVKLYLLRWYAYPSSTSVKFWMLHLQTLLGADTTELFEQINQLTRIYIEGNELRINLNLVRNIKNVSITKSKILFPFSGNGEMEFGISRIELKDVVFVDAHEKCVTTTLSAIINNNQNLIQKVAELIGNNPCDNSSNPDESLVHISDRDRLLP